MRQGQFVPHAPLDKMPDILPTGRALIHAFGTVTEFQDHINLTKIKPPKFLIYSSSHYFMIISMHIYTFGHHQNKFRITKQKGLLFFTLRLILSS